MVTNHALNSPVRKSIAAFVVIAIPQRPMAQGKILVFNLGETPVFHCSSARERLNWALSSNGRNMFTTQAGATAAMKS